MSSVPEKAGHPGAPREDEPPVVARMVIEIRSDGTRTIARGVMEDETLGQRVAVEAEGTTPAMLAASLVRSLAKLPILMTPAERAVRLVRALLGPPRKR
jgi:hypothetical protein